MSQSRFLEIAKDSLSLTPFQKVLTKNAHGSRVNEVKQGSLPWFGDIFFPYMQTVCSRKTRETAANFLTPPHQFPYCRPYSNFQKCSNDILVVGPSLN